MNRAALSRIVFVLGVAASLILVALSIQRSLHPDSATIAVYSGGLLSSIFMLIPVAFSTQTILNIAERSRLVDRRLRRRFLLTSIGLFAVYWVVYIWAVSAMPNTQAELMADPNWSENGWAPLRVANVVATLAVGTQLVLFSRALSILVRGTK